GPDADNRNGGEQRDLPECGPVTRGEVDGEADSRAKRAGSNGRIAGAAGRGHDYREAGHSRTTRVCVSRSWTARPSPTRPGRNPRPSRRIDGTVSSARYDICRGVGSGSSSGAASPTTRRPKTILPIVLPFPTLKLKR